MADYSNSKMAKAFAENKSFISKLVQRMKKLRKAGDTTNFNIKNKNAAKETSFSYIFSRHSSTGRFGASPQPDILDSIRSLDTSDTSSMTSYFDPFSMKVIKKRPDGEAGQARDSDGQDEIVPDLIVSEEMISSQGADSESTDEIVSEAEASGAGSTVSTAVSGEESDPADKIRDDFVKRVGFEIDYARANDFEAHYAKEETAANAFGEVVSSDGFDEETYNPGKTFKSDTPVIEDVPTDFDMELLVDSAPPKYSQEYGQFRASETRGIWGTIKGAFRKLFRQSEPTPDQQFKSFVTSLPDYRRTMALNRSVAIAMNQDYDPESDPQLKLIEQDARAAAASNVQDFGHAAVRMNAKKSGMLLSSYSFGFGVEGTPGMAGSIVGYVENPARISGRVVKGDYNIRYSDYLRAAAKIRGTVGSMRTYTMIGYNCTSFATDVAHAAGIPLKMEDTSSIVMTHKSHSQRVDSPYMLAQHLIEQEKRKDKDEAGIKAIAAKDMKEAARTRYLTAKYLRQFMQNEVTNKITDVSLLPVSELQEKISQLISNIAAKTATLDRLYPIEGLEGPARDRVIEDRIRGRRSLLGVDTETEAIEAYLKDKNKLAALLLSGMDNVNIIDLFGGDLKEENIDNYKRILKEIPLVREHYSKILEDGKDEYLGHIINAIFLRQGSLRENIIGRLDFSQWNKVNARGSNTPDYLKFIDAIYNALQGAYSLPMLGEGVFNSEALLQQFITLAKIPVDPEKDDYNYYDPEDY